MHSAQLSEICFFEKKDTTDLFIKFWIAYFKEFMQSNRLSNRDIKIELAGGTRNKPRYENLRFMLMKFKMNRNATNARKHWA